MHTINVTSWKEYQEEIRAIKSRYAASQAGKNQSEVDIVFRGQPDSDCPLSTTLERYARVPEQTFLDYMDVALSCVPEIDSLPHHQECRWNLPSLHDIEKEIEAHSAVSLTPKLPVPCIRLLAYLRHHGFPSPLLDWTRSYETAAFFAFSDENRAKEAAVFVYIEMPHNKIKVFGEDTPLIWVYDPVPENMHKRHRLQQSVYTMCIEDTGIAWRFVSHEKVTACGSDEQDLLIKIVLPRQERLDVLADLHKRGVNDFSLFESADRLMKKLAFDKNDVFLRQKRRVPRAVGSDS